MKKLFVLILLLNSFIHGDVLAQRNFRIKKGAIKSYIVPPDVRLRFKWGNKGMKEKFSYFYVRLMNLTGNYESDMVRLKESVSWNGKVDQAAAEIASGSAGCTCSNSAQNTFFKWNFLNNRSGNFILQINFKALNAGDVNENYRVMMTELVKSLAVLEADESCDCAKKIKFDRGFSQQVIKKLKERIPVPIDLPQPGSCITVVLDQSYVMLLDDDIILKVDDIKKIETPFGNDKKFRYEWSGFNYFSFKRALDGAIKQNSLASFNNGLPNNEFQKDVYSLASFADIVSSEALKDVRYIALYHPLLKRNNNHSSTSSPGMYSPGDDTKILEGNAFLLHFRSSELATLNFDQKHDDSDGITKSFFSGRGSIAPMIKVYINGEEKIEDFDSNSSNISEIPKKFNLYRKYEDNYRKIKGEKNKLILLPNDHLTYTL